MNSRRWDIVLGGLCLAFALLAVLGWIPASVESGLIEKVRRQILIGDALLPTVCAVLVGGIGLLLLVSGWNTPPRDVTRGGGPDRASLQFIATLVGIVGLALVLMLNLGPWLVALSQALGADLPSYRDLRDTAPWKYLGYLGGGTFMVFALITYIQGRLSLRCAIIALVAVTAMAMIYDLPFKHLLLPPNGDQ